MMGEPLQYASGYSLDLYCRNLGKGPATAEMSDSFHPFQGGENSYFGETFGECAKLARADGWIIHRTKHKSTQNI